VNQQRSETILVVEDDFMLLHVVETILSSRGYRVLRAQSPEEAFGHFGHDGNVIDLVIADVIMPHESGPSMIRTMIAQRPELRVLFISGYSEEIIRERSQGLDFDVLPKPFTMLRLLEKVRTTLDRAPVAA
jgi:two-component system cell cycle sensor histidine kinase/response regulator CckA